MSFMRIAYQEFLAEARSQKRFLDPTKEYKDKVLALLKDQVINFNEFQALGPDIATGKVITKCKGKVFYEGIGLIDSHEKIPNKFDPKYKLIEIDGQGLNLQYEALFNLTSLKHLKTLDLSDNIEMDSFCCDKIASIFSSTNCLKNLYLYNNKRIDDNSLVAIAKIKSLEYLCVTKINLGGYYNLSNLVIELFKEYRPDVELKVEEENELLVK